MESLRNGVGRGVAVDVMVKNLECSAIKSKGTKNVQVFLNRGAIELSVGDAPNAITSRIPRHQWAAPSRPS